MRRGFRLARAAAFSIVVGVVSACDRPSTDGREALLRTDSSGVELVMNAGPGAWGDTLIRPAEVLRIGVRDGDERYQFFGISDIAIGRQGTLFVGSMTSATVRAFSSDGRFLAAFGGHGGGPSEFNMVNELWTTGDTVVVVDWQRRGKVGLFDQRGEFLTSWPMSTTEGGRVNLVSRARDGWVGQYQDPSFFPRSLDPGESFRIEQDLRVIEPKPLTVGPVRFALPPRVLYGSSVTEGVDWPLFEPWTAFGFDARHRLYTTEGPSYRINVFDASGRLIRVVSRADEPVSITDADIEELKGLVAAVHDTLSIPPAARQRTRERSRDRIEQQARFPRPATFTPLGSIEVAPDGAFWVERTHVYTPAEYELRRYFGNRVRVERPSRWDVFDRNGGFLGTVELPVGFAAKASTADGIVGVLKDELDVEYVVRYAIPD